MAAAVTDEGPVLVFDLIKRKHRCNLERNTALYGEFGATDVRINAAGNRLLFNTDTPLPGASRKSETTDHLVVWDIEKAKEVGRMHDAEVEKQYRLAKSDEFSSVEKVHLVEDSNVVLTTNMDNIVRMYDMDTGKLLRRLSGHTTTVRLAINNKCPYVLSYGMGDEEDCFRLWDKRTGEFKTSFSLDENVYDMQWSQDGKFFITFNTSSPTDVVIWRIRYGLDHVTRIDESDYPTRFDLKDDSAVGRDPIHMRMDDKMEEREADDPDSDPEEPEDDDDEDID